MLINIRGTSGSGKSTIIFALMEMFDATPIKAGGKVTDYRLTTPYGDVYIIGRYETACGGCDGIKTQDEVCARVRKYARKGHVVFEGLLVTSCYSRYRVLLDELDQPYVMAFMTTPIKTCIRRVEKRRHARGNKKPLNPANTVAKYEHCQRTLARCKADGGSCLELNWRDPISQVVDLLKQNRLTGAKRAA